ncbi:RHS repeat-associated core domain-containing protein [Pseudomonas putida]|uniref:RHS repeat-associated core domain-containing protein n=1 Tax=Pseudomonas putida TaxID=303 RepID=UPI003906D2A3
MGRIEMAVNRNTPTVKVQDNRGLAVREIAFYRHPDQLDESQVRITHHHFAAPGFLTQSADPRLADAGIANFIFHNDLRGKALHTRSVDAGTSVNLKDIAGRPLLIVNGILSTGYSSEDHSQAVSHTWHYEVPTLPGRPLAVSEQVVYEVPRTTQRFIYAASTASDKDLNIAGLCISHYDTAGLMANESFALSGVPLSITRRLLNAATDTDMQVDWHGADPSAWNALLAAERYTTVTHTDASGKVLLTLDAAGHQQRVAYGVNGQLACSWLTVKQGAEQPVVLSLAYSAAGRTLSETHGNGVRCIYRYEPRTQRLAIIQLQRATGFLQDLRYRYDPVGNVFNAKDETQQTRIWRNQRVASASVYGYDSLYQLVSASGREMANAGRQNSQSTPATLPLGGDNATYTRYTRLYHYDTAGNLTQIRHSAPATNNCYTTDITVSNRSNRGVSSTLASSPEEVEARFTNAGQQRELQPGQRLHWTSRGELQKITPVTRHGAPSDHELYRYDARHQRVSKGSNQAASHQQVIYLPQLEMRTTSNKNKVTERLQIMSLGKADSAYIRLLHWSTGKPTGIDNNSLRYHYTDLVGSSGFDVDGYGNIISIEEYYPYGETSAWLARPGVEASYKSVRFSGKERDATGLYYFGHRYYHPLAGRWMSSDPALTVDGLNLYAMVCNNPATHVDDSGLMLRSPATAQATPDTVTVAARGLANFPSEDAVKVLWALTNAEAALESAIAAPPDPWIMMESFGPAYYERQGEITQAWKNVKSLSGKYFFDEFLNSKLLKVNGGDPGVVASVPKGDTSGIIRFHDSFFHESTTDMIRTHFLIHELTHLGTIIGVSAPGAYSADFFYIGRKGEETSYRIARLGWLDPNELEQPKLFLEETAKHYGLSTIDSSDTELTYRSNNTTHVLPITSAVGWFWQDPSFRAKVTSRNADSLAFAAMRMAKKM